MNIEKSVWAVATYLINFINFNAIIVSAHIVLLHKIQDLGCTVLLIICLKQGNLYNLFIICLASYSYMLLLACPGTYIRCSLDTALAAVMALRVQYYTQWTTHINSRIRTVTVTPSTRVVQANTAAAVDGIADSAVDGTADPSSLLVIADMRVGLLASPRPADVVAATNTTYCCIGIRFAISTLF